jgi:hypothetical protein
MTSAVFEWKPTQVESAEDPGSIAVMMDEIWTSVAEAHYDGNGPEYLVLPSATFRKLTEIKERELSHGVPLMILGLRIIEG